MNILFIMGRPSPPFFFGGAEISSRILASKLLKHSYVVSFLGSYSHPKHGSKREYFDSYIAQLMELEPLRDDLKCESEIIRYKFNGITCEMVPIEKLMHTFYKHVEMRSPAMVITMLEKAPCVINACNKIGIPSVAWIHDTYPVGLEPLSSSPTHVLYTSNYVKEYALSRYRVEGVVFYPPFERPWKQSQWRGGRFQHYKYSHDRYITMINPIPEKGGEIFLRLAEEFPEERFLAVEGWRRSELIQNRCLKNITYIEKQWDLSPVWSKTKVLLVPSQMEEGFGRVIIEAGMHGVPSIASAKGGLPEAIGDGGILVHGESIREWVYLLKENNKAPALESLSQKCVKNSEKFMDDPVMRLRNRGILPDCPDSAWRT